MTDEASTSDQKQALFNALYAIAIEEHELSEYVQRFAAWYVIENVGTKAARAAGYAPTSASQRSSEALQDRRVVALIQRLRAALPDLRPIDPDAVQRRLAMLAMTDATSLLVPDERYPGADPPIYRWKRPEELTPGERALVQDVRVDTRFVKDEYGEERPVQSFAYKVLSNKDALDSLARTHGMFRDRHEHEHTHKVEHLFRFIAENPERSETVARLNAKHGKAVIDGNTGKAL